MFKKKYVEKKTKVVEKSMFEIANNSVRKKQSLSYELSQRIWELERELAFCVNKKKRIDKAILQQEKDFNFNRLYEERMDETKK